MRARQPARTAAGRYTLLELLVAIALLGMLVGVTFFVASAVADTWQRVDRETRQTEELLALDLALDRLLSNIVPFSWPGDDQVEVLLFVGEERELRCVSRQPARPDHAGTLRFCRFTLEDGALTVASRDVPPLPTTGGEPGVERGVLARGVRAVQWQYAALAEDGGRLDWLGDWGDRSDLPLAVAVTLTWDDGRHCTWLRRTAGMGAWSRPAHWEGLAPGAPR